MHVVLVGFVLPTLAALASKPLSHAGMANSAPTSRAAIRMLDQVATSSPSPGIEAQAVQLSNTELKVAESRLSMVLVRAQSPRSGRAERMDLMKAIEAADALGLRSQTMTEARALLGLKEGDPSSTQAGTGKCSGFIAESFTGGKPGFVFKRGPCGVGYYPKAGQRSVAEPMNAVLPIEMPMRGVVAPANLATAKPEDGEPDEITREPDEVTREPDEVTRMPVIDAKSEARAALETRAAQARAICADAANEKVDLLAALDAAYDVYMEAHAACKTAEQALSTVRAELDAAEDKLGAAIMTVESGAVGSGSSVPVKAVAAESCASADEAPSIESRANAVTDATAIEAVLAWRSGLGGEQWQVRWRGDDATAPCETWERWDVVVVNVDAAQLRRVEELRA